LSLVRGLAILAAALLAARGPVATIATVALFQTGAWWLAWWGTHVEPFRVEVTHVDVVDPRLPNPGNALRIVQLSDLHVERLTARERALPALVRGLAPDLLVLTGDFLNTSYQRDAEAAADLAALLRELEAPLGVYAVWGTAHVDHPDILRPVLEGAGVEVLEDRGVAVRRDGRAQLWLMGVTPTWNPDADAETARELLTQAPAGTFSVLLYHLPDLMPAAAAMGVDLYLAGHTHGGQWRVPGFGALVTSSRYGKRYEAGAYREGDTRLYVSRGLGMEGFGTPRVRLFCRPEVVVLDLAGGDRG
jgi:predicted MPP superfamily phosphohydrolase